MNGLLYAELEHDGPHSEWADQWVQNPLLVNENAWGPLFVMALSRRGAEMEDS